MQRGTFARLRSATQHDAVPDHPLVPGGRDAGALSSRHR